MNAVACNSVAHYDFRNLEASSRIYSPYVFAIGQLLGEMPYSILCAVLYWVLMVWWPHALTFMVR